MGTDQQSLVQALLGSTSGQSLSQNSFNLLTGGNQGLFGATPDVFGGAGNPNGGAGNPNGGMMQIPQINDAFNPMPAPVPFTPPAASSGPPVPPGFSLEGITYNPGSTTSGVENLVNSSGGAMPWQELNPGWQSTWGSDIIRNPF